MTERTRAVGWGLARRALVGLGWSRQAGRSRGSKHLSKSLPVRRVFPDHLITCLTSMMFRCPGSPGFP